MLFKREHQPNPTKLKIARNQSQIGFADLLSYLMLLDEETVLHKDGSLSRHFAYIAHDLDSATGEALDRYAALWKRALGYLDDGWMVEANLISTYSRQYSKTQVFPEVVSALIDDERRMQYESDTYFQSHQVLSITYRPPQVMVGKLKRFAVTQDGIDLNQSECVKIFNETVQRFTDALSEVMQAFYPLKAERLLGFLSGCVTGNSQPFSVSRLGGFLDSALSHQDFQGGFVPKIGDQYIQVIAIDDLPLATIPCILDRLGNLQCEYRWSSRFIPLGKESSLKYLEKHRKAWSNAAIGLMGSIRQQLGLHPKVNQDAMNMANKLEQEKTQIHSGDLAYGFYSSVMVLMHEDQAQLHKQSQQICKVIESLQFRSRVEKINAVEAYLGSLPGHGDYNLRKVLITSDTIAHGFPTSSLYQGEPECPNATYYGKGQPPLLYTATKGNRPYTFNLHIKDVGHSLIIGPTGSGKSTFLATLIASHRKYDGSRIIVLDKDYSNRHVIKALGGEYFDLLKEECQFSPLGRIGPDNEVELNQALDWLIGLFTCRNIEITPAMQSQLREDLWVLSHESQVHKNLSHLVLQDPILRPALQNYIQTLQGRLLNGTSISQDRSEMKGAAASKVSEGSERRTGVYRSVHEDSSTEPTNQLAAEAAFQSASVMGFEMGELCKSQGDHLGNSVPVIEAMFQEFQRAFADRRPTLLILEEGWLFLQHPRFSHQIEDWLRTLRKFNVAVIITTQSLRDILAHSNSHAIRESCPTTVFLPNDRAETQGIADDYKAFGLNEQQIHIISQAIPKQHYYCVNPLGNRLFSLDLGELALAFLALSETDRKTFEQIFDPSDSAWVLKWLQYKKLNNWHDFALKHYVRETSHA